MSKTLIRAYEALMALCCFGVAGIAWFDPSQHSLPEWVWMPTALLGLAHAYYLIFPFSGVSKP